MKLLGAVGQRRNIDAAECARWLQMYFAALITRSSGLSISGQTNAWVQMVHNSEPKRDLAGRAVSSPQPFHEHLLLTLCSATLAGRAKSVAIKAHHAPTAEVVDQVWCPCLGKLEAALSHNSLVCRTSTTTRNTEPRSRVIISKE